MRLLISLLLACIVAIYLQAESYVYVEDGIKLPLKNEGVVVYAGTPVKIISKDGDNYKVQIEGYLGKEKKGLYATKNLKLLLAKVDNPKLFKKEKSKKVSLIFTIPKKYITDDIDDAWEYGSDLFYDKCTRCHHAKVIEKHTMREWNVLYNSMKFKAKTTKDEDKKILRFLRAFAKDGILKESD